MTRSSRHKSSKRSSRDARDYSDSEKDSSLKDRKGKDESSSVRVSKESGGSGEKRKLDLKDTKDVLGSGNGDYEEYNSSSKRRKDRADDSGNDRWNGGGEDERTEGSSRKSKVSSETKSKRRDDDEQQRPKSEGKHRESSRKENREMERERERKGKEGKSERFAESEEHKKQLAVNEKTESNAQDRLPSPESENQVERRVRRRRDDSGDGDKPEVDVGDINDRRRDDVANDGRLKDEKHKDERYRDKYRDDMDRDSRYRDDKQRDERPARDHTSGRSDDKHLRDEKDAAETRPKKSKPQDNDRDRKHEYDHDRDRDHDHDRDHYRDRDRDRDYDHDRNRDRDHNRDHDGDREWDHERNRELERDRDRDRRDRERDRERERERDRDRDRNRDRDRDLEHDRDRDLDHDGSHLEDRSVKYKDSKGKKRSPDERDDSNDTKSRGIKTHYPDTENKSLSSNRVESDADRGRSQSRQAYIDSTVSSNRRRTSPSSSSHGGDEYRHPKQEDMKYRDSVAEQRPKAISSREATGFSGVSDRGSKYRSTERAGKLDDGHLGELSVERSSGSKASPMGLTERSPSSTSHDRRYVNRSGIRRSIDIEETGRRGSVGPRELSASEDRLNRELPLEKPLDESSQLDVLFYHRSTQNNSSSSLPPPPAFRGGVGSPSFMGSLEEDGRVNMNARYRRSGDPSVGRGQGNAWRGGPNWSSPLPNGFMHFQHGPPHGGFQGMMPQFPSPALFTVRPSMEMNHSGIPYHIPDADRFSGHLRPLGWQNMMDGSGPPHMHGWDGNNGVFRDEPHLYGGSEWDQNRHPVNGRGWETSSDVWKGENGDVNMDLPSAFQKDDHPLQAPLDDDFAEQAGQQTQYENNHQGVLEKAVDSRSIISSKESSKISSTTSHEKTSDPSKKSSDNNVVNHCRAYLSKLDISEELTAPELFSKCMSLLEIDQTAALDKETTVIVNLKDGGSAVPKNCKALSGPRFFPAANDSVFQRAMDQYKKQRVQISCLQMVNGGTADIFSTSNQQKVEQSSLYNVEKAEEAVLISDAEMSDAPVLTSDLKKPEAVTDTDVQETMDVLVSTPSQVVPDDTDAPTINLELPDQSFTQSSEEPVPILNGDNMEDRMTSEQVISENADGDHSPSVDVASHAAAILPTSENMIGNNNSVCPAEEVRAIADAISDPLFLSDGSPKVTGALMPGSNESESVILSRIHHSPESTH